MPAYFTAAAFSNLRTSPISATICAPSLWEIPGMVVISSSDLGDLPLDELDLLGEELDLEGEGVVGHPDSARALRDGLGLPELAGKRIAF